LVRDVGAMLSVEHICLRFAGFQSVIFNIKDIITLEQFEEKLKNQKIGRKFVTTKKVLRIKVGLKKELI
jgi:hypothetical protein